MKAILCSQYCQPDDLVLTEIPDPVAGPNEAVIAIKAAALNFFDLLMIQGKYQIKPPFPFSPAAEVAGVIDGVGPGVTDLKVGDRVVASCGHNGAREKIALPASSIVKIPDNLDFDRAAGIIIIYGTALHALEDRASPQPGETLAVLGAAGGTGLAAIELGKVMGARVIACASSADKLAFAREHGADLGVNYGEEDLKEALRRVTDGRGVDVVYDPVGGAYAEAALRSIAWGGRFLVIGFAAGEIPKLPLNLVLLKGCDVRGVFWGQFTERYPEKHRANMVDVLQWAVAGKLSAHVHAVYPLEKIADALKALASELGVTIKVGVVLGDDLLTRTAALRDARITEMFSGAPFPQRVASINAYHAAKNAVLTDIGKLCAAHAGQLTEAYARIDLGGAEPGITVLEPDASAALKRCLVDNLRKASYPKRPPGQPAKSVDRIPLKETAMPGMH